MDPISKEVIQLIKDDPSQGYLLAMALTTNILDINNNEKRKKLFLQFIDINPEVIKYIPFQSVWDEDILLLLAKKKEFDRLETILEINEYMKFAAHYQVIAHKNVFSYEFCKLILKQSDTFFKYFPEEFKHAFIFVEARVERIQESAFEKRRHVLKLLK
jgi:hypothetical protein